MIDADGGDDVGDGADLLCKCITASGVIGTVARGGLA